MCPQIQILCPDEWRLSGARCGISAILFAVRNSFFTLLTTGVIAFLLLSPVRAAGQSVAQQEAPSTAPQQIPAPSPSSPVIVLDPGHGGTDSGARGESGGVEKDIVLQIARTVRAELERQGYRVVLTRNDDSNPAYDDRAAVANAYRDAIFISLHVSSTGTPGTVRAYYDQFAAPVSEAIPATGTSARSVATPAVGLATWEEAQRPYVDASRHLADLIQIELAERFPASPDTSAGAAVRVLRSVVAPAVAIELSSVSDPNPNSLTGAAPPLASAIGRAIMASRASATGAK